MVIIFFLISMLASMAGAICGIGGGVVIKPVLDMFNLLSVSAISFLSGCTVLAMTCYSVGRALAAKETAIDTRIGTPLAIGAAVGGVAGKQLFSTVTGLFENANTIGAVQAACLLIVTLGTLLYTLKKEKIATHRVGRIAVCTLIGLILGLISSFLGIGGGPVNLVFLSFFSRWTPKPPHRIRCT